jgi:predicted acetyltransferase
VSDEPAARAAHRELLDDDFTFLLALEDGESWAEYVARLERYRHGVDVPERFVPATFLAAEVDGELVGRVSIRHRLNDVLATWGGHIGYAVRPAYRRTGYATDMLRQALEVATDLGLERVMVCCADENVGSATVIERCGGVLDAVIPANSEHSTTRQYWIRLERGAGHTRGPVALV